MFYINNLESGSMSLWFWTQTLLELLDLNPDIKNTDPQAWLALLRVRSVPTYSGSSSFIGLTEYATEITREGHKNPKV